jgi:isoleucyl-tRNA synthetase
MTTPVDYKTTLNLPQTAFPMRGNLPQKEPAILAKWDAMDLYKTVRVHNQDNEKFILHLGPPYANGDIHLGHAVSTILKDIVVKYKTLCGYDSPLVPGWDCHGLPIEVNVEKKIGLANVDVTPKEFRQACRDYAQSQIELQRTSFIRLGILADWKHPYSTMDHSYEAGIIRSIGKIYDQGCIHSGAKPVHWCINCGSALAEAEVEYQNKTSPAIDVAFRVVDNEAFLKAVFQKETSHSINKVAVVIWTTTPWTLPANQAVALHPELDYALVKTTGVLDLDAVCVLEACLEDFLKRIGCEHSDVLATFKGGQLEKQMLQHPFYDRAVPIVLGDHVTTDAGTGAVHTAPGHGVEDYAVGIQYGLSIDSPVGDKGCFLSTVPLVAGLHVLKANDKIIEILKEHNNLVHATTVSHSYPHCWRHKTPLIFRATPQWFIGMEANHLRHATLDAIKQVNWVPEWGESRIRSMIEVRPDWCISRQRTWGVPLALVLHKETKTVHPQMSEIFAYVSDVVQKEGIEGWHDLELNSLPFKDLEQYEKSKDILDVWLESGVSHTAVLKARSDLRFPADLYLEGSDQHRGWFHSSILTSVAMYQQAPYRQVLTHGFTVDEKGHKMSKSLGNVIAPEKVIKTMGADVLRLWVAATDYKGDIHVSNEILNRMADAYRRLRNTMRFLLANLDGFEYEQHVVDKDNLLALDAWIVDVAARLQDEIFEAYETYQFHQIYQKIHNFCVVELGSFYLDIIKDRQYTTKTNSVVRRSAQTAMYRIAHAMTRWLAPILSFTAEEVWEYLPGTKESTVFLSQWNKDLARLSPSAAMSNDFWQQMIQVRACVNKALEVMRNKGEMGAPLDANITLYAKDELYDRLMLLKNELKFVFITSGAVVKPLGEKPGHATATERDDLWLDVILNPHDKCVRCWHHCEDVNHHTTYPGLCGRCVSNVDPDSSGEERHYA